MFFRNKGSLNSCNASFSKGKANEAMLTMRNDVAKKVLHPVFVVPRICISPVNGLKYETMFLQNSDDIRLLYALIWLVSLIR